MKSSLKVGTTGKLTSDVGPGQTITLGEDRRATVFATPAMINLMEHAAREALRPHLDQGEESVGIDVQITHSSATPPKAQVIAEATVTAVEKNVISFDVVARDRWGEIGSGSHRRAVIDTARFAERLENQKLSSLVEQPTAKPTGLKTITLRHGETHLRMTLSRPEKRNAVNLDMTAEIEQVVDWLGTHHSDVHVVIVEGSGNTFCSGDDVGDLPDDPQAARVLSLRRGELYRRIAELPQIFIAAIDGRALGGGLVLAASCDFRIASHRAEFGLPEVLLGWPPNYGLGIVGSLIGRGHTLELALGGATVEARRAQAIGLVNKVVSVAQLESEVTTLAQRLASSSGEALAAAKGLLAPEKNWSDEKASDAFAQCLSSDTARKSLERFKH